MLELVVLGILFNVVVYAFSRGMPSKGIDSMPAIPIVVGCLYGTSPGMWAGVIIAVAYHAMRPKSLHYTPLTVFTNALVGFLGGYLAGFGVLMAGVVLLLLYHFISGIIVAKFGGLGPGYMAFIAMNFVTTLAILYVSSFVL